MQEKGQQAGPKGGERPLRGHRGPLLPGPRHLPRRPEEPPRKPEYCLSPDLSPPASGLRLPPAPPPKLSTLSHIPKPTSMTEIIRARGGRDEANDLCHGCSGFSPFTMESPEEVCGSIPRICPCVRYSCGRALRMAHPVVRFPYHFSIVKFLISQGPLPFVPGPSSHENGNYSIFPP